MDQENKIDDQLAICSLDTNVLLRWLLGDNIAQLEQVEKIIQNSKLKKIHISDIVLAEIVWVMQSVYKMDRDQITEGLKVILAYPKFVLNKALFENILELYASNSQVSFTDLMLALYAKLNNASPLLTFDKKLAKTIENTKLIEV